LFHCFIYSHDIDNDGDECIGDDDESIGDGDGDGGEGDECGNDNEGIVGL